MTRYQVPLDEIQFTLRHVTNLDALGDLAGFAQTDRELVDAMLTEAARFFEQVVAPTNREGDLFGAQHNNDGSVTTTPSFAKTYQQQVQAGWNSVAMPAEHGGGGFPWLLGLAIQEMLASANMAYSLCSLLTQAAIDALTHHGSPSQKATYLEKMVSGEWSGTMNLTEPQAGSDVGAITTRAEPAGDGTWRLFGQKIYITWGEHDLTDNIIHLVLARTPDAPKGTAGISLFIVPKFLVNERGELTQRNDVHCISLEHKLGIHASPTCVMSFGERNGAVGYLVGEQHTGMSAMFTMMNNARLSVGLEGVALAERAYQQALEHALQRCQGKAPETGNKTQSPIVEHPDVARMLVDMAAAIAAMRSLCYRNAEALDWAVCGPNQEVRDKASETAALLTPLSKAWCSDLGFEITSIGIQIHGGMGYIEETGASQHMRDVRIAPIYEGTNGIQALDLVVRKLPMRGGAALGDLLATVAKTIAAAQGEELRSVVPHLESAHQAVEQAAKWLLSKLKTNRVDALAGATPFLEMLATTVAAGALTDGAINALREPTSHEAVDRAVLVRAFAANRLAKVQAMLPSVTAGAKDLQIARKRLLIQ